MKSKNRFEGFITKLFVLCVIAGVATLASPLFSADAQTVNIPDANLRTALEQALGKAVGDAITEAELGGLRQLDARNKSIATLTGLEKATGLRSLNLKGNSIADISPAVNLPRLRLLVIENNPLSYASLYTHIPAIERAMANRNNASVTYTSRTPGTLTKISGDSQTSQASTTLTNPFVVEVKDGANPAAVFADVPVTFAVTAGGGTLSATTVSTGSIGRAQTTLTLGSTGGANTVTASVTHAETTLSVTFTATAEVSNSAPTFSSGTSFSVAENSTAVGTVSASDADSQDSITGYTLGGADSAKFSITNTGVLTFANAPNYEIPGDALSATPANAATNNEYIITVTATSGADARAMTATQTLTITVTDVTEAPGKPDAPTVTAPNAKPTELSVSWTIPTNTGPSITDYDVQYRVGTIGDFTDADFTGTTTSTTLTGLTTGTDYQVQVRATNDEGTSPWSDAGSATTATNVAPVFSSTTTDISVPENTTDVTTATATDADGDTVTYALSGADSAAFSLSTTSGELTFSTAPDYENPTDAQSTTPANDASDNEYVVTITATSGAAARTLSTSTTLIITVTDVDEPPAKPDAPTVTAAHATPTSLSVSWTAPTNTGKPAITDYDVRYRDGNSGNLTDADFTGTATSTTLTGLTAGTGYEVQVLAKNDEGTGSWSDTGSATTAANAAPTFDGLATIAFSVAENTTAVTTATATDADTGDTITYALSGADSAAFSLSTTSGELTFSTAPDFENPTDVQSTTPANAASNREYIATITATSGTGARALSVSKTLTITVTDANEPPAAPTALTVSPVANTATQLNVSWTAPTVPTSIPALSGYDVEYRKGTSGTWLTTNVTHSGTNVTATITGLTGSTSYQVHVRAKNAEGNSAWLQGSATTAEGNVAPVFSSPTTAFSVAENTTAVTTATATDSDASDTVTYALSGADRAKFSISTSGALVFSTAPDFENPTDVQSTTPANVASNNVYIVTVTATSGAGARALSVSKTLTITVTDANEPPAAPTALTVSPVANTPTQLNVSWKAPTVPTSIPALSGYDVEYRKGTSGTWLTTNVTHSGTNVTATITGLTGGTSYQVHVRAKNAEGNSAWLQGSATTTAVNVAPVFSSPTTAFSVAENTTAVTTATATDSDASDSVTYALSGADRAKFSISTLGVLTFSTAPDYETPTDVQSTTPANEANNREYIVTVTATGGTAARALSVSKTLTITVTNANEPPAKPNAPTVTDDANTPTQLNVSWSAPTNTGKPRITGYKVQYRKGTTGTFTDWPHTGTAVTTTITGLTAGTLYQVQVSATNDEGTGSWSDAGSGTTVDPPVRIPDVNLRAAINTALGSTRAKNAVITESEITSLTTLRWDKSGQPAQRIQDLTGLEKATSLTTLSLDSNAVSNLTPLAGLTSLTTLELSANAISNLTPLAGLTNLTNLSLNEMGSRLTDISPLAGLTNLTTLALGENAITDISPLEDLTNLTSLGLGENLRLSDISSLEELTKLKNLHLSNNAITNVSPLKSNTGLGTGDKVWLVGNPLSYPSIYTHIPVIQARGATVSFTSRVPGTLTKISGDTQTGKAGTALANPFVVEVKDSARFRPQTFAGVKVTFAVTAGGGTLSATSTTTGTNGRAEAKLTLGTTAGKNTVTASMTYAGTTHSVTFNADANVAPKFSSSTKDFSVPENTTAVTTVTATDANSGDTVTYALSGADSAKFSISTAGALTFRTAPDFENPTDAQSTEPENAAANNVYIVKVTATGGTGARALPASKELTITVTDVNEPPAKPDAPTVTVASHSSLNVSWSAPTNTGKPDITGYKVRYRKGTTGDFTDWPHTGTATTTTITGLEPNTSYQVQVRAKNDEGTGPWSEAGTGKTDYQPEDVNKDGDVDVDDLIDIGKHLGGTANPAHEPDVNGDGTVNNADSQLVARAALQNSNALTDIDGDGDVDVDDLVDFAGTPVDVNGDTTADDDDIKLIARIALNAGNDDAAPAHSQIHAALNAQNLQHLVQQARQRNRFDATYRRGLAALERILESLIIPEESALLPNYPNPFNPETWIPYQLASPAEVTLTLYDVTGRVVRTLHLGHQHAGMYRSKSRAAYWDGRNAQGEPVASGVYFYTLVAGEFAATGKMLIRK